MKKTQKKIVGAFGLSLVVGMTIFAATLPGPEASAINTVTDHLNVRVIEEGAEVKIVSPASGSVFSGPDQKIVVDYANVNEATITITYTGRDGIPHSYVTTETGLNYDPVEKTYTLDLSDESKYGFGDYVFSVKATGLDGQPVEEVIRFSYLPIVADLEEEEMTGDYEIDLDYIPDDGTEEGKGNVDTILINIYDADGNPVGPSPIRVDAPATSVSFNLDEYGLPDGVYTVELSAYDRDGNLLYKPFVIGVINYKGVVPTPDTGAPFQNLNISRTDYLVTGLIIFGIVGLGGFMFIAKRNKNKK